MVVVLQRQINLTEIIRECVFYGYWLMLPIGISCGLHGYIIQDDSKLLQGMIQVTGYTSVPCIYCREATDAIFGSIGHTFVPHTSFHIPRLKYTCG